MIQAIIRKTTTTTKYSSRKEIKIQVFNFDLVAKTNKIEKKRENQQQVSNLFFFFLFQNRKKSME